VAVAEIGLGEQREQVARAVAAEDARGIKPVHFAQRLAQQARRALGIDFEDFAGPRESSLRARAGAQRAFIGRELDGFATARAGTPGHIGGDGHDAGLRRGSVSHKGSVARWFRARLSRPDHSETALPWQRKRQSSSGPRWGWSAAWGARSGWGRKLVAFLRRAMAGNSSFFAETICTPAKGVWNIRPPRSSRRADFRTGPKATGGKCRVSRQARGVNEWSRSNRSSWERE